MNNPTDPSSEPPWDPTVPGPREGADGWATPGGPERGGPDGGHGGGGYDGGFGAPGAGHAPGFGDPYGGGPTVGGPNAYGPNAYGPRGTGGPFGPGTGGWAPKPGVVPLRPLGVGELLDGAFSYIRAHPRVVLGTSAVVAVIAYLVGVPLSRLVGGAGPAPGPTTNLTQLSDSLSASAAASLPQSIVVFLAQTVLTGLLMVIISRAVLGAPVDAGEAWRAVRPRIPGLVGVALLTGLAAGVVLAVGFLPGGLLIGAGATVAGGIVLVLGVLVALLAALAVWIAFSLAPPVYVLEGGGVIGALRRSWTLVRPRFWPVLGVTLLALVISWIVSVIVVAPFGILAGVLVVTSGPGALTGLLPVLLSAVGGVIGMALVTPFQAGVTGLLYVDQRMRREGFDLELRRAAQGA